MRIAFTEMLHGKLMERCVEFEMSHITLFNVESIDEDITIKLTMIQELMNNEIGYDIDFTDVADS